MEILGDSGVLTLGLLVTQLWICQEEKRNGKEDFVLPMSSWPVWDYFDWTLD